MEPLFQTGPVYPQGFFYFPEFLNVSEADALLAEVSKIELHAFNFQGFEAKRRVASFGYDYSFDKASLSRGEEIPIIFNPLIEKVARQLFLDAKDFSELLVTEYPAGSVINWHRDAFPFDVVVGISLLSDCTFRLRPHDKAKQTRGSIISMPVRQRSLYVLRGTVRTDWQHSIAPVKSVRYSITLRTLKKGKVN
jgi:alkylated DNA repair dioxygenase AlkB